MLEDAVIVGLVMILVEIVKRVAKKYMDEEAVTQIVVPLSVFILAGGLNVWAGYIFAPELPWQETLRDGLVMGAVASGLYGLGKAAIGKS